MPPLKHRRASLFQGQPAGGWTPSRRRPVLKRDRTAEPPDPVDDAVATEAPATGIATRGSASSRKL